MPEKQVQGLGKELHSISLEDLYVMAALAGSCSREGIAWEQRADLAVKIGKETYRQMHGEKENANISI